MKIYESQVALDVEILMMTNKIAKKKIIIIKFCTFVVFKLLKVSFLYDESYVLF